MSSRRDQRDQRPDDSNPDRDASMPMLRTWWTELSSAGKVLVPTAALVLVFVTVSAVPPLAL